MLATTHIERCAEDAGTLISLDLSVTAVSDDHKASSWRALRRFADKSETEEGSESIPSLYLPGDA